MIDLKQNPVAAGARAGLRPPTREAPWQWAARNVRIQNSERSSKFDPEQTPWWKGPMECAADATTRHVVVIAPTGSGKSTMAEALIPYVVSEDPGNFLYASQTDEDAKFWGESRLTAALKSCPTVAALWPVDRHKSRKLEIIFAHMALILGGANHSNFQEKSVRWLYGDEVWKWAAGLVREFLARHHERWNRKVFLVSQGGTEGKIDPETGEPSGGDELWQEWIKTDQGDFSWRCTCGHAQPFAFESLTYDTIKRRDGSIDEQATADTTKLACGACGKLHDDTVMSRRALASSNMGNGAMGYIPRNGSPLRGMKGFHVDALAVWWVPWSSDVLQHLEAKRMLRAGVAEKFRQWWQKRRARFWSEDYSESQVSLVRKSDFKTSDYANGETVDGEVARLMTVDAGDDHYWVTIAAWRANGTARLIFEGFVLSDGRDETELEKLRARYKVPGPKVLIDSSWDPTRIITLCAKFGWLAVKGDGKRRSFPHQGKNGTIEKLFSKITKQRNPNGTIGRYIFLATNPLKDVLQMMLTSDEPAFELPSDLSKAFETHMKSEKRIISKDAKTGQESTIWIQKTRRNHLWDCLTYQVGGGFILEMFGE